MKRRRSTAAALLPSCLLRGWKTRYGINNQPSKSFHGFSLAFTPSSGARRTPNARRRRRRRPIIDLHTRRQAYSYSQPCQSRLPPKRVASSCSRPPRRRHHAVTSTFRQCSRCQTRFPHGSVASPRPPPQYTMPRCWESSSSERRSVRWLRTTAGLAPRTRPGSKSCAANCRPACGQPCSSSSASCGQLRPRTFPQGGSCCPPLPALSSTCGCLRRAARSSRCCRRVRRWVTTLWRPAGSSSTVASSVGWRSAPTSPSISSRRGSRRSRRTPQPTAGMATTTFPPFACGVRTTSCPTRLLLRRQRRQWQGRRAPTGGGGGGPPPCSPRYVSAYRVAWVASAR